MEQEFPCSPDTSFEIPSIIEAISSSIDDSHFNFNELEQSTEGSSTTNESDYMEVEGSWSQPTPQQPDQYNQNYYQNYQPQQQQQQNWNYQQGYSQYPQYGYMTPSPYNSYYMESPPVDYHHNYAYNTNMMSNYEQQPQPQQQQQPYMFNGNQNSAINPQNAEFSCSICIRTFKNSSNLTRHYASKTHVKRLESKKLNSKVSIIRNKKPRVNGIGSSFTDISKDERAFLWQLDDEIFQFLQIYEQENARNQVKQDLALPTPPLSPNSRAIEERKFANGPQSSSGLVKTESVITIASSSENLHGSPLSVRSSSVESVDQLPKMEDSENMKVNIKEESNITSNLSPGSVKTEILTSNCNNSDNTTSNSDNLDALTSKCKQTSDITSKNVQNNAVSLNSANLGNTTLNIQQSGEITSKDNQNNSITSNNTNFDVITVKSEYIANITSNDEVASSPTISQPSSSSEYQTNSISTNLTTEFSNMASITNEYGDQFVKLEPQMNFKTETQPLTYENSTNITSNYENHYSPNPHLNYYNANHLTSNNQNLQSHGQGYQQVASYATTNSTTSGHITSNYVNSCHVNASNAGYSSTNTGGYQSNPSPIHQSTNYVVMKNITSKSSLNSNNVNITSNNLQGIKITPNNPKSAALKYQTVTNLLTSGNKATSNLNSNLTSNPQINLQSSNKVTTNRIITINPSTLTKASTTTASGLRITSINPNITSNNGGAKNPTTYTLTSSNSGIRYLNATNLIGNNVKIQQISPNGIKNFRIVNNSHQALQNKVKIPHSGCNVQQNSPSYGQSSPSYVQNSPNHAVNSPKTVFNVENSPNYPQNSPSQPQLTESEQQVHQNVSTTPSRQAEPQFSIPNSPSTPSSPTVLIQQETGEKYEIIFSDENFGDNFS